MFMHISLHLNDVISLWEPTKGVDFVAQSFIGCLAIIWVFKGFDGVCSISGSKIMAKLLEQWFPNFVKRNPNLSLMKSHNPSLKHRKIILRA